MAVQQLAAVDAAAAEGRLASLGWATRGCGVTLVMRG